MNDVNPAKSASAFYKTLGRKIIQSVRSKEQFKTGLLGRNDKEGVKESLNELNILNRAGNSVGSHAGGAASPHT